MLHFLWLISAICGTMLILQIAIVQYFISRLNLFILNLFLIFHKFQSQNINNYVVLVSVVFNLIWTLALVFVPCEIGERVRSEFMKLNFTIGQFNWYFFSYEIQKTLPIIIINAQADVLIQWFGSISCVREVFKKVCHLIIYFQSNTRVH